MPFDTVTALAAGEPPSVVDRRLDAREPATIEVELPSGIKLRLTGAVDTAALRQVISALA